MTDQKQPMTGKQISDAVREAVEELNALAESMRKAMEKAFKEAGIPGQVIIQDAYRVKAFSLAARKLCRKKNVKSSHVLSLIKGTK